MAYYEVLVARNVNVLFVTWKQTDSNAIVIQLYFNEYQTKQKTNLKSHKYDIHSSWLWSIVETALERISSANFANKYGVIG